MNRDLCLAFVGLIVFVVCLARAERDFRQPALDSRQTWTYTTATWRYVHPHTPREWWHNLTVALGGS